MIRFFFTTYEATAIFYAKPIIPDFHPSEMGQKKNIFVWQFHASNFLFRLHFDSRIPKFGFLGSVC